MAVTRNDVLSYLEGANMLEISELIKDIEEYLDTKCQDIISKATNKVVPRKTASLERLMNRAFTQALFQGRQDVTSIDILLSVFSEKKSYGSFFLKKHNFQYFH